MAKTERLHIGVAFGIVSTVWGTTWLAIRVGLEMVPPFLSAGVRCALAAVLLYGLVRLRRIAVPWTRDAWNVYLSLGVLTIGIPFALVYWGQQFIPTGLSSILFAAYPLWVALLSHLLLRDEPLTAFKVIAVLLGFFGVAVIFSAETSISDSRAFFGMAAVLVSTFLQALALVIIKKVGKPVSPVAMNFVGMAMGGCMLLVLTVLVESGMPVTWTGPAVLSLLYLTIVGSVVTFVANYWLLKRIDAVYLSLSSFINPIVAVILGSLMLGERLPPGVFMGAMLVFSGLLVANGKALHARLVR